MKWLLKDDLRVYHMYEMLSLKYVKYFSLFVI